MCQIPLAIQCIYRCSDKGSEVGNGKEGREWRLPGFLYADDLVLWGESEEDLRGMVGWFVEVCRRELKVRGGPERDGGMVC